MPTKPLPIEDLDHILTQAGPAFESLRHANLFITGGTGFFGHWLLESLLHANDRVALNLRATVLTRSAAAFQAKSPHITGHAAVTLLEGDVASFVFPAGAHTHVVHAATDSGGQQANQPPQALAESILAGTQHVLDCAVQTGATQFLYTSTGAVYGRSTTLPHTPEIYLETHPPQLPEHSYEAAKLAAENLCLSYPQLSPVLARCFAFVGPHLPLDQHFAIGNFLGAAMRHERIHIKGDGTPRRSWLYMADLAIWLWTMLAQGEPNRAYNVGSDDGMTIAEAARLVAKLPLDSSSPPFHLSSRSEAERSASSTATDPLTVQIDGTPNPAAPLNSYVPDIARAHIELGLSVTIPLKDALLRTAAWHRSN